MIAQNSPERTTELTQVRSQRVSPRKSTSPPAASVQPMDVLHAVRRRWLIGLALGLLLGPALAYVGWQAIKPMYTAETYVQISSNNRPLIFETADQATGNALSFKLYKNTQLQLMKTEQVLNAALNDLASLPLIQNTANQIAFLQENLKLDYPGDGELLVLSFETESPTDCVKIVNAVATAYMKEIVNDEKQAREERLTILENAYFKAESELIETQGQLQDLAERLGTGNVDSLTLAQQAALQQSGLVQEQLFNVGTQLSEAMADLELAKQLEAAAAEREPQQQEQVEPAPPVPEKSADVARLEEEVALIQIRLNAISSTAGRAHPKVQALERELAHRKSMLRKALEENDRIYQARLQQAQSVSSQAMIPSQSNPSLNQYALNSSILATKVQRLQAREQQLQQMAKDLEEEWRKVGKSTVQLELKRDEVSRLKEIHNNLGEEIERTDIEMNTSSRIDFPDPAKTSRPPSPKKRLAAAGAAGLFGLFAPLSLLCVWDLTRRRVNSVESVTNALNLETLGTIPTMRISDRSRSSTKGKRKQRAVVEAIDSLAAMVVHRADVEEKQVFMVSSALPGEGKSTVSCQLAHSIALAGKKVALVDFDLRRPSIHEMLQVPLEPGIADVLQGRFNWNDITHTSPISPNLHTLTAGSPFNGLQRFWNSGAIDRLFAELRNSYDLVIVDGCPILPVADSRIIGKMSDGVILSLIRDRSSLPKAVEACELLKSYGVPVFGTVFLGASNSGYTSKYYYASNYSEPNTTAPMVSGKPK